MAESFSDPESHAGTVYKATNWIHAGDSKGFSQDHTDYYLPNERPKKLWLKPLDPKAAVPMCAPHLPEECQAALTAGGGARSPVKSGQLKSLRQAFALVPDPRRAQSRRHPLTADPLHNKQTKQPTLRVIVDKGGDYLVGTKKNTAKRLEAVQAAIGGTPFLI